MALPVRPTRQTKLTSVALVLPITLFPFTAPDDGTHISQPVSPYCHYGLIYAHPCSCNSIRRTIAGIVRSTWSIKSARVRPIWLLWFTGLVYCNQSNEINEKNQAN